MTNKVWFQFGVGIILTLVIIRLFIEVKDIFFPILVIIQTIFLPLLIGGVLFYLCRPLLRFLESRKWKRWASMLAIFVALALLIWLLVAMIGPAVTKQVNEFMKDVPTYTEEVEQLASYVWDKRDQLPESIQNLINDQSSKVGQWSSAFASGLLSFIQSLFQGLFLLILVPFFLVYLLKDHENFVPFISKFFRGESKKWVVKTLRDIDYTLMAYIQGQVLVSVLVGVMLFIGYLTIGLDYALLLALFGMFMNVIPFLGPYIAVVPALIIGYIEAPEMAIWVGLIMLASQQIESNFITPNIMGKSLNIHPLTVITVILAAGNIAGLWGIILAIPVYAVVKTVVKNLYARREQIKEAATMDVEE